MEIYIITSHIARVLRNGDQTNDANYRHKVIIDEQKARDEFERLARNLKPVKWEVEGSIVAAYPEKLALDCCEIDSAEECAEWNHGFFDAESDKCDNLDCADAEIID